ncbi:hypothetical protein C6499_11010 [Candidatus Poribacteria bacterium]|nr:MAG: hypothetical protein C6499_11010 [Candidatus Poribacteria bacterium]
MQRHLKRILVAVAVLTALGFPTVQAEERELLLHWKNGDMLPGQLNGSGSGTIHWTSPYFLDDLVLDVGVLDSVAFPKPSVLTTGAFRVDAVSGDVWVADLIDSDADTFLFSSERHGQFRVKRSAIYRLDRVERQERQDFLFNGSELMNWKSSKPEKDMTDPTSLLFDRLHSNWYADAEGHPQTGVAKAEIFHALNWPERFEIELELASTAQPPNFVFALGEDLFQALRLEIWENELVAVQGTLFKSVLAVQPEQRNFHLRLAYDASTGVLKVSDFAENLLIKLEGVKPTTERPGLYIQNRGEDLIVRRLGVYPQFADPTAQQLDLSKPRVYMMNDEVIQGKLFVQKDNVYVLDTDGTRRDVDLLQVTRAVQPGTPLITADQPITLEYPDGVVLHGEFVEVKPDSVLLQTAFADEPITCSLVDVSRLRFETNTPLIRGDKEGLNEDKLFYASNTLRGRVLFHGKGTSALIQWKSIGALKPVRLANNRVKRIKRLLPPTSDASHYFDTAQFPHTLHLQSGEIVPCQIIASDGTTLSFQSPFIHAQRMDLASMKALEFADRTHAINLNETRPKDSQYSVSITTTKWNNGLEDAKIQQIMVQADDTKFVIDGDNVKVVDGKMVLRINEGRLMIDEGGLKKQPVQDWIEIAPGFLPVESRRSKQNDKMDLKLERALTVPHFSRDTPPSHILMANNGDMKRGKLLSFNGQAIQFDSKLRRSSVPMDRVARVVNVSKPNMHPDKPVLPGDTPKGQVCVKLTDGSILVFDPLEVREGKLLGRSPIYGAVSVPIESIESLYFGEKAKFFKDAFEEWVVRPAKEPVYND